jgi:hypothetical protein
VNQLRPLELGHVFRNPRGEPVKLCVALFLFLGDHEENNSLAWLYPKACRRCYRQTVNGMWVTRSKSLFLSDADQMVLKYRQNKGKQETYARSKELQQHIGYPALTKLKLFDPYSLQIPACPGTNQLCSLTYLNRSF